VNLFKILYPNKYIYFYKSITLMSYIRPLYRLN